jgi:hypothetical protein
MTPAAPSRWWAYVWLGLFLAGAIALAAGWL